MKVLFTLYWAQALKAKAGDYADEFMNVLRILEESVPVERIWLDMAEKPDESNEPLGGLSEGEALEINTITTDSDVSDKFDFGNTVVSIGGTKFHDLDGNVDVDVDGETTTVGITRVHMEEDTGKSTHLGESGQMSLFAGGDRLHQPTVRELPFAFYNLYGPTENTVITTSARVDGEASEGDGGE